MRHGWLPPFLISIACSVGSSTGLSAAENAFTLEEATIADIHQAMAAGALSSEKLVQLYLARIAAYDRAGPRLNSIIYINPNAKAEAAALDKERADKGPRGPLHGIPVLLKDNIDVAGVPTTNGYFGHEGGHSERGRLYHQGPADSRCGDPGQGSNG